MDWIVAVERLGGWGVVIFIVIWGMKRFDKIASQRDAQVSQMLETFTATIESQGVAIATFKKFESQQVSFRETAVLSQANVASALSKVADRLGQNTEKLAELVSAVRTKAS